MSETQSLEPQTKQPIQRISQHLVKLAENQYNRHCAIAEENHTIRDVLHPGYLWHAHGRIQRRHIIEIVHPADAFFVELYVVKVDVETQSILTRALRVVDWSDELAPVADLSGAKIEKKGADGWRVINGTSVLARNFESREHAEVWLGKRRQVA